jgi:hypothetical protein
MSDVERRLALSGGLVGIGIIGQMLTLYWEHPLAFLAFLFVGSSLVLAGSLIYLWALLRR